jgi:hypothetical protein
MILRECKGMIHACGMTIRARQTPRHSYRIAA